MQQETFKSEFCFYNSYCNLLRTAFNSFVSVEKTERVLENLKLSEEEILTLARFVLAKNAMANVGEVLLKTPSISVLQLFDEFGLKGKVVIGIEQLESLRAKDVIGERIVLEIPDILAENEKTLSQISDLSAKMKLPLIVSFGRTLEEVGRLSQIYRCSPARMLEDFGFLDRECSLRGCNFIDKDDFEVISGYGCQILLSPRSDMMLGRGAVNLCAIENKGLKYRFASDQVPIIDMASEGELARGNTSNLLYERGLISNESLTQALLSEGDIGSSELPLENIFNLPYCRNFDEEKFQKFKTEAEKIIKEKLWK